MFALFYNLYMAMFTGNWESLGLYEITTQIASPLQKVIMILTSIFNNVSTPVNETFTTTDILRVTSLVLTLITSIGIVVMAVKGVKKAFGIFFMGLR